jgi:hypothetical protein
MVFISHEGSQSKLLDGEGFVIMMMRGNKFSGDSDWE